MSFLSIRHIRRCINIISTSSQKRQYTSAVCEKTRMNIVWLDMEMTGLDVDTCQILEVACLVTDRSLNVVSDDFSVVIHQPSEVLQNMNDWCKHHFAASGLTDESEKSEVTTEKAEELLLEYLAPYVPEKQCPLAGNSVYMDRMFLMKYMPRVHEYLHHRLIDVSTIKELARRWHPAAYGRKKRFAHRALSDVKESIDELRKYTNTMFNDTCNQNIRRNI